jgi:HAD superfamily hydrolase (TIGR01549 family)
MRAVLLDLDDTLSDHSHSSQAALREVCRATPALAARPFATLLADHATILEVVHLELLRGALTMEAARAERFRRLFAQHGCDADPAGAAACYREAYQRARQAVPGALALLEQLRGRAVVAVVSNNVQAEQEGKLRHLGMTHLIDAMVVSETVGVAKPDPAIFAAALGQLGCAAEDAVMLGDSWAADVLGARAAGVRAVWLNRHGLLCPDPTLAHELSSLEPTALVVDLLLGQGAP